MAKRKFVRPAIARHIHDMKYVRTSTEFKGGLGRGGKKEIYKVYECAEFGCNHVETEKQ
jgi:hypothetical protein